MVERKILKSEPGSLVGTAQPKYEISSGDPRHPGADQRDALSQKEQAIVPVGEGSPHCTERRTAQIVHLRHCLLRGRHRRAVRRRPLSVLVPLPKLLDKRVRRYESSAVHGAQASTETARRNRLRKSRSPPLVYLPTRSCFLYGHRDSFPFFSRRPARPCPAYALSARPSGRPANPAAPIGDQPLRASVRRFLSSPGTTDAQELRRLGGA